MAKPKGTIHRKFSDEEVRQIEVMGGLGMPLEQIAAIFDISPATMDRRVADDKRISEALKRGAAKASSKVRQTAFQMAVSGDSPAMTIFWLKVRERWCEPRPDPIEFGSDSPIMLAYDPNQRIPKPVHPVTPIEPKGAITDGKEGRKKPEEK
jgi:hypothetical protein